MNFILAVKLAKKKKKIDAHNTKNLIKNLPIASTVSSGNFK